MPFQVGVGHIRLLGEYHEPEPEDREMPLGCLWTGRKPVSVAEGPFKQNTEQAESRYRWV